MLSFLERPIERLPLILLNVLLYIILMIALFVGYQYLTGQEIPLPQPNVDWWDVGHYHYILLNGYSIDHTRTAFYPLFPYLWRWSGLDMLGMSIVNGLLFITAFSLLMKELKPTGAFLWAMLTLPFNFFYFIPYSESLFFFITTFLILGIRREKPLWIILALFISCLTRPTSQVYIPAILLTAYLTYPAENPQKQLLFSTKNIFAYLSAVILGQATVMSIHAFQTGNPFAFYEAQKHWGHKIKPFKLPLTSEGNEYMFFPDVNSFYIGIIPIVLVALLLVRRLEPSVNLSFSLLKDILKRKEALLSTLYLAGITGLIMLFQGGELHSFSRYMTCTPFFMVFFAFAYPYFRLKGKGYLYFFLLFMIWGVFTVFMVHHIQITLKFLVLILYWMLVALMNEKGNIKRWAYVLFICLQLGAGVVYTSMFFHRQWVQ